MHGNETELFLLSPEQPFPERAEPLLCSVQEKWCTKLGNTNQPSPGTEQVGYLNRPLNGNEDAWTGEA